MAEPDVDSILDDALDDFEVVFEDDINDNEINNIGSESKENETSTDDNDDTIEQALKEVASGVDEVNEETNKYGDTDMKDFFKQILDAFSNISENDNNNENNNENNDQVFDNALKQIMSSFFDPQSLREPVEMIVTKYPKWLNENKSKLSENDFNNYEKQYKLYLEAWNYIKQNEKNNTPLAKKDEIMSLLLQTFSHGSLPSEVMDGMMPDELKFFADKMTQLENDMKNEDENNNENNNNNNNNNENSNKNNEEEPFDMNECLKLFEQLMGDDNENGNDGKETKDGNNNNGENNNNNSNGNNPNIEGFLPDMNQIPKLSPQEMQQFSALLGENGGECSMM